MDVFRLSDLNNVTIWAMQLLHCLASVSAEIDNLSLTALRLNVCLKCCGQINFCPQVRFGPNCHLVNMLCCFKMEIKEILNVKILNLSILRLTTRLRSYLIRAKALHIYSPPYESPPSPQSNKSPR